jgi:ribosomal protein L7Ae-like RNA K-turn-binding protein
MTEPTQTVPQAEPVQEPQVVLDKITSIQTVLTIALHHGGVVKGIAEVCKALEAQKAKVVFIAEDCDNEQYKDTLKALAAQFSVPVVEVGTWIELKDFCKLGLQSKTIREIAEQKGKEPKIKPKCSSCAIIDWGEDSEAKKFLEKEIAGH